MGLDISSRHTSNPSAPAAGFSTVFPLGATDAAVGYRFIRADGTVRNFATLEDAQTITGALTLSALLTANAGITLGANQNLTGSGTGALSGFKSGSFGTAGNAGTLVLLGTTSGAATFSVNATATTVSLNKTFEIGDGAGLPQLRLRGADASNSLLSFDKANSTGMWQMYRVATSHDFKMDSNSSNVLTITQAGTWNLNGNSLTAGAISGTTGTFSGDVTRSSANAGGNNDVWSKNTDNANAASHARFIAQTGGASGGDPVLIWDVLSGSTWSAGIDNSTGVSNWTLSASSALGTNNVLKALTTGLAVTGTLSTTGVATLFSGGDGNGVVVGTGFSSGISIEVQTAAGNSGLAWRSNTATAGHYRVLRVDGGNNGIFYDHNNVGMYMAEGAQSWTASSDERLKTIIEPFQNALSQVLKTRTVRGYFNKDTSKRSHSFLIAQDWQDYLPEAINEKDGILGLSYQDTIPVAFAAIKELESRVRVLEAR